MILFYAMFNHCNKTAVNKHFIEFDSKHDIRRQSYMVKL